jgi:hypothetical protein
VLTFLPPLEALVRSFLAAKELALRLRQEELKQLSPTSPKNFSRIGASKCGLQKTHPKSPWRDGIGKGKEIALQGHNL